MSKVRLAMRFVAVTIAAASSAWAAAAQPSVSAIALTQGMLMLSVEGVNVVLQSGPQGTLVVDPGPASSAAAVLAAIKQRTSAPIRYVVDTNADPELVGGNATIASAGRSLMQNPLGRPAGNFVNSSIGSIAMIVAPQSALLAMASAPGATYASEGLPTEVFTRPSYNFFLNGDAVRVITMPAAHSSADSIVVFRQAGVVVAGDIYDDSRFPVIDVAHGGSIQGEIDALNQLLNDLVLVPTPVVTDGGGTLLIPVRGAVSDQAELLAYRDMVGIIRDRVRDLMSEGKSLEQIQQQGPTQGYDARYGASSGAWTTRDFVAAVYNSLKAQQSARRRH
jgi:glyoxylase-like metal-dependent hydrolase (beta-lactamase superfamily II)